MPYRSSSPSCVSFSTVTPTRSSTRSRPRWHGGQDLEFELAARLRDRLDAVRKAIAKQQMVADKNEDLDVIGSPKTNSKRRCRCSTSARAASWAEGVLSRQGRGPHAGRLIDRVLETLYGRRTDFGVPKQVLVPYCGRRPRRVRGVARTRPRLEGADPRAAARRQGSAARDGHAQREGEFTRHRMKRAATTTRAAGRSPSCRILGSARSPVADRVLRHGHIQGTDYVGSMVVIEDGLPAKREYRRFKVNEVGSVVGGQSDDYAAMAEVVRRRLHGLPRRA